MKKTYYRIEKSMDNTYFFFGQTWTVIYTIP